MSAINRTFLRSPVGLLEINGDEDSIKSIRFLEGNISGSNDTTPYLEYCSEQLNQYFKGARKEFDLNLTPSGTDFQKKVWNDLVKIPFGETKSYLWQSERLGDVKAIRAVAGANGRNQIPIIIPCHRVIGKNGELTGYAGGLWRKKWLIQHEQKICGFSVQLELLS